MTKKTVPLKDLQKTVASFVYRPTNANQEPKAINATLGVKFAKRTVILDDWYLLGGTRLSRSLFRLRHPIIYSKRGLRKLYRRIKRFLFGEVPAHLCREIIDKKDAFKYWPERWDVE